MLGFVFFAKSGNYFDIFGCVLTALPPTLSICEGREFIARLPGTNAQLKI
jgi:hypothetical protein